MPGRQGLSLASAGATASGRHRPGAAHPRRLSSRRAWHRRHTVPGPNTIRRPRWQRRPPGGSQVTTVPSTLPGISPGSPTPPVAGSEPTTQRGHRSSSARGQSGNPCGPSCAVELVPAGHPGVSDAADRAGLRPRRRGGLVVPSLVAGPSPLDLLGRQRDVTRAPPRQPLLRGCTPAPRGASR